MHPKTHNPAFLKLVDQARSRVREVTVEDYRSEAKTSTPPVLVDVREDHEWEQGHAADAVHLGKGIIERDAESKFPDKSTPLVLYCGGGYRSALAADALQQMGYTHVASLAGGWRAIVDSGMATSR